MIIKSLKIFWTVYALIIFIIIGSIFFVIELLLLAFIRSAYRAASDLDAFIVAGYVPDLYKFIGKEELVNYPFIGQVVQQLYITVNRRSEKSRRQSLRNMKKQSNKGAHIIVFPEGWANFSNEYLLDFKKGAFKVALDLQLPILVCTIIS
jgi:1-acyl-sn-glycerol-3-phosphate acyltransferase